MFIEYCAGLNAWFNPTDKDIVEFNLKIDDRLAIAVSAHELEPCLWERSAHGTVLHQYWRG